MSLKILATYTCDMCGKSTRRYIPPNKCADIFGDAHYVIDDLKAYPPGLSYITEGGYQMMVCNACLEYAIEVARPDRYQRGENG